MRKLPNLVLVNAGTNDCTREDIDARFASYRMEGMVLDLFESIPEVTVILSGLMPQIDVPTCTERLNREYSAIARQMEADGRKIVFADLVSRYSTAQCTFADHIVQWLHDPRRSHRWDSPNRCRLREAGGRLV